MLTQKGRSRAANKCDTCHEQTDALCLFPSGLFFPYHYNEVWAENWCQQITAQFSTVFNPLRCNKGESWELFGVRWREKLCLLGTLFYRALQGWRSCFCKLAWALREMSQLPVLQCSRLKWPIFQHISQDLKQEKCFVTEPRSLLHQQYQNLKQIWYTNNRLTPMCYAVMYLWSRTCQNVYVFNRR